MDPNEVESYEQGVNIHAHLDGLPADVRDESPGEIRPQQFQV